jgi:hypothetical protein
VLRKILVPNTSEVCGQFGILHVEEHRNLYRSWGTVRVVELRFQCT